MKNKLLKKCVTFTLALLMVIAITLISAISASAKSYVKNPSNANGNNYTSSSSLASMLNTIFAGDIDVYSNSACTKEVTMPIGTNTNMSKTDPAYYVKNKTTGGVISGWECYIYANAVYNKLFNEYPYHGTSFSHSEVVVSGGSNTVTYEMFKNAGVRCGAYVRTTENKNGAYDGNKGHSLIILSYDSEYINYLEGNGDNNGAIQITNMTWAEFNEVNLSKRYISHIVQPTATYFNSLYPTDTSKRDPKLTSWVSTKGEGYTVEEATKITSGTTQTRYYYWFKIYDGNTGDLLNSWDSKDYTATISIYYPDGSLVGSYSYQKNDVNWISWIPSQAGTYKCEIVLTGGWNGTHTTSFTVLPNSYTVSYNANGGSNAPASQTKTHGDDLTITSATPTGKTYTVTFDGNGGSVATNSKQFTQSFVEWNTNASGSGTSYPSGSVYSDDANAILYAKWKNPTFSASNPTRSGYYFLGWYDSTEKNSYGFPIGERYTTRNEITGNLTLYAMWGESPMLLFGDISHNYSIDISDIAALNRYIANLEDNYELYYDPELSFICDLNADGKVDDEDLDLLSKLRVGSIAYEDLPVCQYFTTDSLMLDIEPKKTYAYGESFDYDNLCLVAYYWTNSTYHMLPNNIVVSGYDPYTIGTQTVTISYYQFELTRTVTVNPPEYSVYYNANGGSNAPAAQTKVQGTNLTLSSTVPTRTGYSFAGWSTSNNAATATYQAGGTYSNNANVTLYAVWKANTYTVTYNCNGGSNAPASQTKTYGVNLILSATIPLKTGYTFIGWATSSDATVPSYDAGETYSNNANVTFYAVWIKNTYTIIYNANGGSDAPTAQIKYYGMIITLSTSIPNKEGYSFDGWATSSTATTPNYYAGSSYSENENLVLYAVWSRDTISDDENEIGLDQKFKNEFAKIAGDVDREPQYAELYTLLQIYSMLSADEKDNVSAEFAKLQQMINTYNEQAKAINNEHAEATEIAFAPLVTTGFAFLSALWFLLKKFFWI